MEITIEQLEKVLKEANENPPVATHMNDPDGDAIRRLLGEGFLHEIKRYQYRLTVKGYYAIDTGGYEAFKHGKKQHQEREDRIKVLTIKQLKGNVFQVKYWWVILLINAVVTLIIALISNMFF